MHNSKLKDILLMEAQLTDKISSRSPLTYQELVNAVLSHKDKAITSTNMKSYLQVLNVTMLGTLQKYVETATSNGFLNQDGTVVQKYANDDSTTAVAKSKDLDDSLDSKVKTFIAPKVTNNNLFSEQVFKMLSLMQGQASANGVKNSLMLSGDPGVGKTSFIRSFAKLLGLPLIPVEAPHITEEHIINIPFMIIVGDSVKKDSAVVEISQSSTLKNDGQQFDIVQSESNLVTKLKAMKSVKLKDQEHLQNVAADKNLRPIYAKYKTLIDDVRDQYHAILFLDEYYRNDNMKIRNILRNILNGRIGNDKIPMGTYIVYASNLDDDGVEDIPMNNDFAEMEFKAPDKEQWFKYILNKYEENAKAEFEHIKLDHRVFNKFYKTLNQTDLSFDDVDADVRTSPRRWEELFLYVNANLPVSSVRDAKILMTNVEVNFRNYLEGSVSKIYPKIQKMIIELIQETSGISFDGQTNDAVDWKDTLEQQVKTKIKLGDARKYVPVISGEPGIGKTAHARTIADDLGLHMIHIDVSTLTRESTTGIPVAKQAIGEDGKPVVDQNGNPVMTTEFSKPELLDLIMKKIQEEIEEDSIFPESERKKGQGKYKHLLLLDELTRADAQVFNAIRKLLLEKSFNEQYDLPEDILVISALNPDDAGAMELTKHTRDVLDIVPARASWAKTESYLLSSEKPAGLQEKLGFDLNAATVGALKAMLSHFQSRKDDWRGNPVEKEERLFNMMDGGNIIYISPREITDIVSMTNANILNRLTKIGVMSKLAKNDKMLDTDAMNDDDFIAAMNSEKNKSDAEKESENGIFNPRSRYDDEDYEVFIDAMILEFRDSWASKLSFICKKQQIDPANILSVTTGFIQKNNLVRDQYDGIKTLLVDDVKSIGEMFNAYYENPLELYDSPHFDNYLAVNLGSPQKFVQEITDFISDKIVEIEQNTAAGDYAFKNAAGDTKTMPSVTNKKMELYEVYLTYVYSILRILTSKGEYSGKVKEAEKTGQYLGNLYTSLRSIGAEFMKTHGLVNMFVNDDIVDASRMSRLKEMGGKIRELLAANGIKATGA